MNLPPPPGAAARLGDVDESIDPPDRPAAVGGPDWSEWRSVAEWWFHPLVEERTWRAAAYLGVGMLATLAWFVATVVMFSVALPFLFVLIGFLFVSLALGAVAGMAGVERRRAAWIGVAIEERPLRPERPGFGGLVDRLTNPGRWRQVAFVLVAFFMTSFFFSLAVSVWSASFNVVAAVFSGPDVVGFGDPGLIGMVGRVVFGLLALGVAPRLTVLLATAAAHVTGWFLGPDAVVAMQQRVDAVTENRHDILEAVAEERRRIERNLHDGVQQRLVAIGIDLGLASTKIAEDPDAAAALLDEARDKTRTAIGELRVIGRGLHPAILEDRGLDAALSAVVADAPIPISLRVAPDLRLPVDVEETAYFVAAEAVGNIMKHSEARVASIAVDDDGQRLRMVVHDDGVGGADPARGTGLAGIAARIRGVDGRFDVSSPAGGPTTLTVEVPHA